MLVFLRLLLSLISLVFGWSLLIASLVALIWVGWDYISDHVVLGYRIPSPYDLNQALIYTFVSSLIMAGVFFLNYAAIPGKILLRLAMNGHPVEELSAADAISLLSSNIANRYSIRSPKLYLTSSNKTPALSITTLFGTGILLSRNFVSQLNRSELEWVIAHEMSHISHKDSIYNAIWVSVDNLIYRIHSLQSAIFNFTATAFDHLNIPSGITLFVFFPVVVLILFFRALNFILRLLVLFFDRHLSRLVEYRCDREATKAVGLAPGVAVLSRFILDKGGFFFATHPPTKKRIERLHKKFSCDHPG